MGFLNLAALPTLFLVIGGMLVYQYFDPEIAQSKLYESMGVALSFFFVGGFFEAGGLKGRIAALPIWLLGGLWATGLAFSWWGAWGYTFALPLLLGTLLWWTSGTESREWNRVSGKLPRFIKKSSHLSPEKLRKGIAKLLFVKSDDPYEKEEREHNAKLLALLLNGRAGEYSDRQREFILTQYEGFTQSYSIEKANALAENIRWLKKIVDEKDLGPMPLGPQSRDPDS